LSSKAIRGGSVHGMSDWLARYVDAGRTTPDPEIGAFPASRDESPSGCCPRCRSLAPRNICRGTNVDSRVREIDTEKFMNYDRDPYDFNDNVVEDFSRHSVWSSGLNPATSSSDRTCAKSAPRDVAVGLLHHRRNMLLFGSVGGRPRIPRGLQNLGQPEAHVESEPSHDVLARRTARVRARCAIFAIFVELRSSSVNYKPRPAGSFRCSNCTRLSPSTSEQQHPRASPRCVTGDVFAWMGDPSTGLPAVAVHSNVRQTIPCGLQRPI